VVPTVHVIDTADVAGSFEVRAAGSRIFALYERSSRMTM
jgi:hypothetical protein